jgi:hypothetical protein
MLLWGLLFGLVVWALVTLLFMVPLYVSGRRERNAPV